jgi:hypothetical protein
LASLHQGVAGQQNLFDCYCCTLVVPLLLPKTSEEICYPKLEKLLMIVAVAVVGWRHFPDFVSDRYSNTVRCRRESRRRIEAVHKREILFLHQHLRLNEDDPDHRGRSTMENHVFHGTR